MEVVQSGGNTQQITALGGSIVTTTSEILTQDPPDDTLDEIYFLLENLESSISCQLACGEESLEIQVGFWVVVELRILKLT